jgi:2-polyprenyl-6-methoxyphenol hydroxylase-like FAD-dependent oxidoreductase
MAEHGPGQVFSIYEIEAAGELPADARVMVDRDLTSVYWPLEEGRCRWGFQIRDAAEHEASMERLGQLVAGRAPWCTARPTQIYWSTLGWFESRLTRSFGTRGVWLAGDAAHQAPPVAVHSMNSGLLEARELASRISQVQQGAAAPSLLEQFATEMHETWERLLEPAAAVSALPGADPWVRQHAARILACLPASGDDREALLQQIGLTAAPPGGGAALGPPPPRSGFGEVST